MSFLNPLFLFGLVGTLIPILLHFLNLRKLKKIEFSSIKFLKELHSTKVKKLRLKQLLLLVVRVLIIVAIILAFSRPTIEGNSVLTNYSKSASTVIYLLDNSYSTSVMGKSGTLLNEFKDFIRSRFLEEQSENDVYLIISSVPDSAINVSHYSNSKIDKSLSEIKPSFLPNDLSKSLEAASKILSKSETLKREVYLISDNQSVCFVPTNKIMFPERSVIYCINPEIDHSSNVTLKDISLKNQILEKGKTLNYQITIENSTNKNISNKILALYINSKKVEQKSISLTAGSSKTLNYTSTINDYGYNEVVAEIEDDELKEDNRLYLNFFIPKQIKILLAYENKEDVLLLRAALKNSLTKDRFIIREKLTSKLVSGDFSDNQAKIIFVGNYKTSFAGLKEDLFNGGSVFLLPSSDAKTKNLRELNKLIGVQIFKNIIDFTDQPLKENLGNIKYSHPILNNILNKDKGGIISPELNKYINLAVQKRMDKIISFRDGSSFLAEYHALNGKLIVLAVSPVISWSELPLNAIFAPMMNRIVLYSSNQKQSENYIVDEEIKLLLPQKVLTKPKLILPDKSENMLSLENFNELKSINLKANTPGFVVLFDDKEILNKVAVNINSIESKRKYNSEELIKEYLSSLNFKTENIIFFQRDNYKTILSEARFGKEIWNIFVIAALILIILEMFLSKSAKKDLIEV